MVVFWSFLQPISSPSQTLKGNQCLMMMWLWISVDNEHMENIQKRTRGKHSFDLVFSRKVGYWKMTVNGKKFCGELDSIFFFWRTLVSEMIMRKTRFTCWTLILKVKVEEGENSVVKVKWYEQETTCWCTGDNQWKWKKVKLKPVYVKVKVMWYEQNKQLLVYGRHLFPNVKSESARKWKEKWEKVKVIWYEQKNLLV